MAEAWFEARQVEAWLSGRPVIHQLNLTLNWGSPNGARSQRGRRTLVKLIERSLHPVVPAERTEAVWQQHGESLAAATPARGGDHGAGNAFSPRG